MESSSFAAVAVLVGTLVAAPACAQATRQAKPETPAVALATSGLAGQPIAVMPLTFVQSDRRIPGGTGPSARALTLRQADSLLGDLLLERAPESTWILPPDLRRTAQRAGGIMPSPDKMGQAVMRASGLKDLPDPLRTYVRQMVALIGGGRFAFIPAALYISPGQADSLIVQLSAVVADGRSGRVVYRTLAVGRGATFTEAYFGALDTILPSDAPPPPPPAP